jgi:hypothetical protein
MKYAANEEEISTKIAVILNIDLKLNKVKSRFVIIKIIMKKLILNTGSSKKEAREFTFFQNEKLPNKVIKSEMNNVIFQIGISFFIMLLQR